MLHTQESIVSYPTAHQESKQSQVSIGDAHA